MHACIICKITFFLFQLICFYFYFFYPCFICSLLILLVAAVIQLDSKEMGIKASKKDGKTKMRGGQQRQTGRRAPQPVWAATSGTEKWGDLVKGQAAKPPVVLRFIWTYHLCSLEDFSPSPNPNPGA